MDDLPVVRMRGPLVPHRDALWAILLQQGYTLLSACMLVRVAAHLSGWLDATHLSPSELAEGRIEEYLRHRSRCGCTRHFTRRGLAPIVNALRSLGVVPPPEPVRVDGSAAGQLLRGFETYLLEERGIKEVGRYLYLVRPFLGGLGLSDVSTLKELSAKAVSDFIVREGRSSSVGHLKLKATALRAFLRYLHVRGLCRDLSGAIPRVSGYRLAGLPRAVPEETLRRIESSCDRNTVTGRRDYAILLLLSRLGLRAGEVAALELDDVRWIQGEIVVRGKGTEGVLPLPQDVGDALVDYLKVGRPTSTSRKVFLAMNAPRRELTASAVRHVVRGACQRAGLPPIGSHRLRHSAATLMLRRGASLPEVGQVLRHRRLTSTAIYAKVDYRALRSVSRAWPGGAA